jgi:hypothetical protein
MTADSFLAFVRRFRRPYASMICATALAGCLVAGAFTGNWLPAGLAAAVIPVILGDMAARAVEKIQGAADD